MSVVEFFFDFTSPYTYLAFDRLRASVTRTGSSIAWRPMLLDQVFKETGSSFYEQLKNMGETRARYYNKDLGDWAAFCGKKITTPSVYPLRATKAMCGAIVALEASHLEPYAVASFKAYWQDGLDISDMAVLRQICREVGLDPATFESRLGHPEVERQLRENSTELVARGGFGSPTMFVDDSMFFGNDRIPLVEAALAKASQRRFVLPGQHG